MWADMFETSDHSGDLPDQAKPTPWDALLKKAEQEAAVVADAVMSDSVLTDSIMLAVSAHLSQHDKLEKLRNQFAEADQICRDLRQKAKELMTTLGYNSDWDVADLDSADRDLAESIRLAAENATNVNKLRTETQKQSDLYLIHAIEEISLCASIVVLRQPDRYNGEGEAFCVAYITTFLIRARALEDVPASKAITALADWIKYSPGTKRRAMEPDFLARNKIAASIGRGMGLMTSAALRKALQESISMKPETEQE